MPLFHFSLHYIATSTLSITTTINMTTSVSLSHQYQYRQCFQICTMPSLHPLVSLTTSYWHCLCFELWKKGIFYLNICCYFKNVYIVVNGGPINRWYIILPGQVISSYTFLSFPFLILLYILVKHAYSVRLISYLTRNDFSFLLAKFFTSVLDILGITNKKFPFEECLFIMSCRSRMFMRSKFEEGVDMVKFGAMSSVLRTIYVHHTYIINVI